ncbi:MAG: YegS/Rv2252/BmrU family lipid kinase [Clostridia bacterium]|nr:YegS/Rv2252/BmrU family lipid kinase [Clostridia bacterium]
MKHIFIINPNAGIVSTFDKTYNAIKEYENKYDILIHRTTGEREATQFIKDYAKQNKGEHLRFYACGGDGTINEVANGVMGLENASMSVYPCGSGNDFVKAIGGSEKYLDLEKLLNAKTKKIDLIHIKNHCYCVNVCNFGFDALVAKIANSLKGSKIKRPYEVGKVLAIFCGMRNKITLEADGKILNKDGLMLLTTLANGDYVGGKYQCAPRYKVDDGLMEICLVKPVSVFTFLKLAKQYEKGNHLDDKRFEKYITYTQAKNVKIYSKKPFNICIDGEIINGNEFEIEIIEKAIDFAVIE